MNQIKAIETFYKGYRFRSRLEARWAVFFDTIPINWEYEREGFDLGEGDLYLPDFYLPEQECFVEIKGDISDPSVIGTSHILLPKLSEQSGLWCNLFIGNIGDQIIGGARAGEWKGTEFQLAICENCNSLVITDRNHIPLTDDGAVYCHCYKCNWNFADPENIRLIKAFKAARSARFEHGENGGKP